MDKNSKNAFLKSIEKKDAKKEAMTPVRGRVRRPSRGQQECKIPAQEGFCHDSWGQSIHATTPGGVRRLFAYAKTAALHWTLGVAICEEVDQNLGGFWQNLGDSWQNIGSENATMFAKNNVKKS